MNKKILTALGGAVLLSIAHGALATDATDSNSAGRGDFAYTLELLGDSVEFRLAAAPVSPLAKSAPPGTVRVARIGGRNSAPRRSR